MKSFYLTLFFLYAFLVNAQKRYSPTIIILNSQETIVTKELDSIAKSYEKEGLSNREKENIRKENGDFKLKSKKEIEFLQKMDISSKITYGLNYFLSYKFFEYFQNLLIYPVRESNNSKIETLKLLSERHDVNWIVNIKKMTFYIENETKKCRINYQLFNQKMNEIVIDKEVVVDDKNKGFEFACESGSMDCVINNSVKKLSSSIMGFMGKNRNYWRSR